MRFYQRAKLVDPTGMPLHSRDIPFDSNLLFHYPYASTPCFLLRLAKPTRTSARLKTADDRWYEWQGGVGVNHSVVAYSAICAHQLAYPTREISFIGYRTDKGEQNRFANVIHCCAEHSQYDPADGGRVLAGPAPQPLASILLEHNAKTDEIFALGTLGGEMFDQFFAKYDLRLTLEHGARARRPVGASCKVDRLENYCRQQVRC